jgi:hypothetical protein
MKTESKSTLKMRVIISDEKGNPIREHDETGAVVKEYPRKEG